MMLASITRVVAHPRRVGVVVVTPARRALTPLVRTRDICLSRLIMPPPAAECTDGACARKSEMFTAMRDALHAVDGARASSSPPCPLDIDSLGTSSWGLVRHF